MAKGQKKERKYSKELFRNMLENQKKEVEVSVRGIELISLIVLVVVVTLAVWGFAMSQAAERAEAQKESMRSHLQEVQEALTWTQTENAELTAKNQILSDTVNRKVEEEEARAAQEASLYEPTGIPVNGVTTYEELETEAEIKVEFTSGTGAEIIAAGSGTVLHVGDDEEYGHIVQIDHGNGYITSYRIDESPKVVEGAEVLRGTVLFSITESDRKMGYQITLDGNSINPMDVMETYG